MVDRQETAGAGAGAGAGARLAAFLRRWALAGAAGVASELVTYPLDMLTTRMQLQNELGRRLGAAVVVAAAAATAAAPAAGPPPPPPPPPPALSLTRMALQVVRTEGARALYAGAAVASVRQVFNAGISVGIYHDVRALLLAPGETPAHAPLWKRALAGALTGCCAQLVANPADVVKVRVQADGRLRLAGGAARYAGALDAARKIWALEGGARGFYVGLRASLWRAAILNSAGISAYDHTKQLVARHDPLSATRLGGAGPQLAGSAVTGVVSAVVAAPVNVVRTRVMNDLRYRGRMLDCAVQLVRAEGAGGLFKGFVPTLHRQVLFNGIFWLALEQLQTALGQERL